MAEKVECEICLEGCQEDELEEHREMCMARLMFRCAFCDGDYVSKEGIWNHLDLHEIADKSKEFHYQEIRATYKLLQCVLCNDQRGYQENIYWEHVNKDHDGFFLRCSECGESFRSQKLKDDHDLTHSKAKEQMVKMDENAAAQLEPSQEELSYVPGEDSKYFEINGVDVQAKLIEDNDIDYRLSEHSPANSIGTVDTDSSMTEKEFELLPISSSKSRSETNVDAEKIPLLLPENPSNGSFDTKCSHCGKEFSGFVFLARHIELCHKPHTCDICGITFPTYFKAKYHKRTRHMKLKHKCPHCFKQFYRKKERRMHLFKCKRKKFSCDLCHKKFTASRSLVRHMKKLHHNKRPSKKIQIGHIGCNEEQELYQVEKITVKKEITVEEKTIIPEKSLQPLVQNSSSRSSNTECSFCGKEFFSAVKLAHHIKTCIQSCTRNICGNKLSSIMRVRCHKIKKHTEPQHKCLHCSKIFHRDNVYQNHLSICVSRNFPCGLCGKKFKNLACINDHNRRVHHIEEDLRNIQMDPMNRKNQQEQQQTEQIMLKMEITVEETTLLQQDDFRISMPNLSTITDFPDLSQHSKDEKVENSIALSVNCSEETLTAERKSGILEEFSCTRSDKHIVSSRFIKHSSANLNEADDDTDSFMTVKESEVLSITGLRGRNEAKMFEEENLQPLVENSVNRTSESTCPHCEKEFSSVLYLARHIELSHQSYPCHICGITLPSYHRAQYHKMTAHTEPKYKCPHCPRKFYQNNDIQKHLSVCVSRKVRCEVCGKKFKKLRAANLHRKQAHNIDKALKKAQIEQEGSSQEKKTIISDQLLIGCSERNPPLPQEKIKDTQPLAENLSSSSSETKCSHCGKEFVSVKSLSGHIVCCHKPTTCDICGELFPGADSARYHKKTKHTEPRHKCTNCPMTFFRESHFQKHLTICDRKGFLCKLCGQKIKYLASMKLHMRRVHHIEGDLSDVQIYSIQEQTQAVKLTFNNKISLIQHGKSTPNQSTITDCPDLSQHTEVQEAQVDPELSSLNSSGQSSALTQEYSTDSHNGMESRNDFMSSDREKKDSRLIKLSPANSNHAYDTNNVTEMKAKVHLTTNMKSSSEIKVKAEKTLPPIVDNLLKGSSNTKCIHCGKKCSGVVSLARHIEMNHVPYACDVCGITFSGFLKARYHKITKHMARKHKCPHCPKKFHYEKAYRTHLYHCGSKKFSCKLCDLKFKAFSYAVNHMRNVHNIKGPLKKVLIDRIGCNEKYEQNNIENVVLKKEISVEETTSTPFVIIDCPICGENFGDQIEVSSHVYTIHQMTMCASCGMTFASADQLNDHKLTCPQHLNHVDFQCSSAAISQSNGETSSSGLSNTVCPHCDKDCCHEALLARHITFCHQPTVCTTCGVTVSGKHRMRYHKRKYHTEQKFNLHHDPENVKESKFPCNLCGHKYENALALEGHMKLTHSLKAYQIDRTDRYELDQEPQPNDDVNLKQDENMELKMEIKVEETTLQEQEYQTPDEDRGKPSTITIISASQLTAHKTKDRVNPKFNCKKCHQTFQGIKAFQVHVNKHDNKRVKTRMKKQIFQCKKCNRQLENRQKLQSHMVKEHKRIVKPDGTQRTCPICAVTVSNVDKLRYHKLKYHMERKFKCPDCPRTFFFEGVTLAHMRMHESNKSKRPILLQAHKQHNYENGIKIKEEPLEEMHLITPQSSTKPSHCEEVFSGHNVSDKADDQMEACSICGDTFENRRKMKYHMRVSHTERTHKCSICPITFHHRYMLRRHENIHKRTACQLCSKKFLDGLCLERHFTSVHSYAELLCNKCNLKFDSHHKFNDHMKRFHTEPRFKCPHCGKMYQFQYALRNHMVVHLKTKGNEMSDSMEKSQLLVDGDLAQNQNSSLQNIESEHSDHENDTDIKDEDHSEACSSCGLMFENRRRLEYHKLVTHTEPPNKCSHCPKKFHVMSSLRRHEATHSKILEAEGSLVCDLCPIRFSDDYGLQRHIVNVHPALEMSCGMCDLKFTTRHKLNYHMKKIHTEPSFKCTDCGKLYSIRSALRSHMAMHLKEKQQKRMSASMEMSEMQIDDELEQNQNSTLQKAISERLDHENEIEIKADQSKACSICGIIVSGNMEHHMRTVHIGPKYKCSHCPKMFHSIPRLDRHETTHTKVNVECKLCSKTYRGEHSLQRHVKYAHPCSEVPCNMCDLKFSNHSKLFYHVNTIHKPRFKCAECNKPFHAQYALRTHMDAHSKAKEKKLYSGGSERRRSGANGEKLISDASKPLESNEKRNDSERRRSKRMRTKQLK